MLISLLIIQSYLFNYSQNTLLSLQKAQQQALVQSSNVTQLENEVISLQSQAIAFIDKANKSTIDKFNLYFNHANISLGKLKNSASQRSSEYQNILIRLDEYLHNYKETFDQTVLNRNKRERLYSEQFQKYWRVNKDAINECKDCELRYMCVDNRVPQKSEEGNYFFTSTCGLRV